MVIFMIFAPPHYLSRVKRYSQLLLCEARKRITATSKSLTKIVGQEQKIRWSRTKWNENHKAVSQVKITNPRLKRVQTFIKSRARDWYNPLCPSVGWSVDRSFVGDLSITAPVQFPIALVHQRAFWSIRVVFIRPSLYFRRNQLSHL